MSLFDYYQPTSLSAALRAALPGVLQGKDGPNALLVWVEGVASPVEQRTDPEVQLEPERRDLVRLPARFVIYSHDCPTHGRIEADCRCVEGTWRGTTLRDPSSRKARGTLARSDH